MDKDIIKEKGKKRIFDAYEHLIWKIANNEEELLTPEGYIEIKTDRITISKKIYSRKFFVNLSPVVAELCENIVTKEIGYFKSGKTINNKVYKKQK